LVCTFRVARIIDLSHFAKLHFSFLKEEEEWFSFIFFKNSHFSPRILEPMLAMTQTRQKFGFSFAKLNGF
jgi:hypothetical protein